MCVTQQIGRTEEELRALIDIMPQLVWIGRPDGYIEYHNQRWRDYTRMPFGSAQGNGWCQCIHPDDRQRVLEAWKNAVQMGHSYSIEQRLRDGLTGEYRWFLAKGAPYKNAQGEIVKWIGTLTDIDDKKRAGQELKAREELLRVLAETVPQFVWSTQEDGSLTYANQRYLDYLQVPLEELLGYGWRRFLHPDDYEATLAVRARSLGTGEPYEIEYRLREGRTGEYRWFLVRAAPVRNEAGQVIRWFGTSTDIEDRKHMEDALRQSQEQVNALLSSRIIGIFLAEEDQVVEANDTYLRMTGYTGEDLRAGNINWMQMTPPEYLAVTQQAVQELAVQQYGTPYEKEYICKDGSRLPVLVGVVALRRDPLYTIGFVLDNSARKELEQRKDDFISMAGHELKTPLAALKLQTQLLAKQLAKQGISHSISVLPRMEERANHLERLINELLDVSKMREGRLEYCWEPVDLDALLQSVVEIMQPMSTTHTIVVRGTAPGQLIGDKGRLEQVFTNLINNALKYSPDASMVEIEVSTRGKMVIVSVRDQGIGIPQEQREKVFERFYRASAPGQKAFPGLGMGLYIVAEIVKQHGGTITVESQLGKGSTFYVTLPMERAASLKRA